MLDQSTLVGESDETIPGKFTLHQNFPNPFNGQTTFAYQCSHDCMVNLMVYNLRGELIAQLVNEFQTAENHKIIWDAGAYPSGMYLVTLEIGTGRQVIKTMLVR